MKTNKLQTSNSSAFRIPRPKIDSGFQKQNVLPFRTFRHKQNYPDSRNLCTHTWGEITDQTYLVNGINSDALPKEEENL